MVFAVFFGLVGVHTKDEIALLAESCGEVCDVAGSVFTAEEDLVLWDFTTTSSGGDLVDEEVDSGRVVLDWKGCFKNIAMAIADES